MDTPTKTSTDGILAMPASGYEEGWLQKDRISHCHRVIRHPEPEFEPTLFISGAFQNMDSWARFAKAFARHTTVILSDPPGMGRSDVLPPQYGVDFLADCIHQIIEVHGFERINVVAASYGTPTAFKLAQRYPDVVERIVLAGTMRELPASLRVQIERTVGTALAGDRALLADQVIDGLLCHDPALPIERRLLAERVLRSNILRMSDQELRQYAANTTRLLVHEPLDLSVPLAGPEALVFTGEYDVFTEPKDCQEIARVFDRAWFTTVQRADHLFHIEQFDAVLELLLAFMQGTLTDPKPACNPIVRMWEQQERQATSSGVESPVLP